MAGLAPAQPSFLVPPSAACPEPRLSPPPPDEPWQALLKSEAAAAYVDRHKLRELMLQLAECVILLTLCVRDWPSTMRAELIGHLKPCMTDIYLLI